MNHDFYHSDVKGLAGFSARCKVCRNNARRKAEQAASPVAPIIAEKQPTALPKVKIPIVSENILDALNKKFDATYTVTVQRDRRTYVQIHGNPKQSYKFRNLEELQGIA